MPASLCTLEIWKNKKVKVFQAWFEDDLFILQNWKPEELKPNLQETIILCIKP